MFRIGGQGSSRSYVWTLDLELENVGNEEVPLLAVAS